MQANAVKLQINGRVQGVGFRPTVARIARQLGLSGWVKNTAMGVEIVLATTLPDSFVAALQAQLPPLAQLDSVVCTSYYSEHFVEGFHILATTAGEQHNDTQIPPDVALCSECVQELFDPQSKYYLYPFTTCTNCGPRYTLITNLPYARSNTTLAAFPRCSSCYDEYVNGASRRYHAEACCCPNCGPHYSHELKQVAMALTAGKIVAIKATGGYVLLADASNAAAIAQLRSRKRRKTKPLALMALNTTSIRRFFAQVNPQEQQLLESAAAPIVLLAAHPTSKLAPNIAPNLNSLGFMLANTPLYYLLFYYLLGEPQDYPHQAHELALVVTSANISGGCIITDDQQASQELSSIADLIVSYNREISMPCDDSVARIIGHDQVLIRRARGYAPQPFRLGQSLPEVLGLGAQLKNTLCFIRGTQAYLSQYLGDMEQLTTLAYFHKVLAYYTHVYNFKPQLVVSDLHPDFYVSQLASNFEGEFMQLQHHHAHLCSVVAADPNSCIHEPRVLGCILDGYGYGLHGEALGGELIVFNRDQLEFTTVSQLPQYFIPSGDLAAREPWRIAVAMCLKHNLPLPPHLLDQPNLNQLIELFEKNQFATTTSLGRIFSGVAALLNVVSYSDYEAHAPLELESLVTDPYSDTQTTLIMADGKPNLGYLLEQVYALAFKHNQLTQAVNTFYSGLATMLGQWIKLHAANQGIRQVVISGGCWQSRYLLTRVRHYLRNSKLELIIPNHLSFGDEGISLGQAWYGAMRLMQV